MHKIYYYKATNGKAPVTDYLSKLASRSDKDSRIKFNKITSYIYALAEKGTQIGMPYVKHLEGELWELRPLRDRILFIAWIDGGFLLLHHFMKQTQKTPQREIEQAKRNFVEWKERNSDNE